MKQKLRTVAIYFLSIVALTIISIEVGATLITQYTMYSNGYTGIERHRLADDMGFGMLLMFGLIPEVIIGIISGGILGKKLNGKFKST